MAAEEATPTGKQIGLIIILASMTFTFLIYPWYPTELKAESSGLSWINGRDGRIKRMHYSIGSPIAGKPRWIEVPMHKLEIKIRDDGKNYCTIKFLRPVFGINDYFYEPWSATLLVADEEEREKWVHNFHRHIISAYSDGKW